MDSLRRVGAAETEADARDVTEPDQRQPRITPIIVDECQWQKVIQLGVSIQDVDAPEQPVPGDLISVDFGEGAAAL